MIMLLKNRLGRFRKEDDGALFILEFLILAPLLFSAFFFGFELSMYSVRQMLLDRSLEVTTRQVRLNTSTQFSHDALKNAICVNTGGLDDCEENLRLEMVSMNPRTFTGLPSTPDCVNAGQVVTPVRGWSVGQQHELMLLRACYRFKPVFGMVSLGAALRKDQDGMATMVSISAFVQEPR